MEPLPSGLSLFGAVGIIIGPIVAALFITIWDLYGKAFKDILSEPEEDGLVPAVVLASSGGAQEEGHD